MADSCWTSDGRGCCILQDVFNLYPSLTSCTLCLTERTLFVRKVSKVTEQRNSNNNNSDINVSDIVGCRTVVKRTATSRGSGDDGVVSCYLRLYYYPLKVTGGILSKQLRREKNVSNFLMRNFETYVDNVDVIDKWKCVISWMLKGRRFGPEGTYKLPEMLPPPRKLLFILNPHSGPGKALGIFKDQVVPLMTESNIEYEMRITERANFGRDFMKNADLSNWNGIVAVSGDGLLFEIFNGLMEREDWETAIKVPIGVIPGGSGNGLARAINYGLGEPYDTTSVTCSILNIISGRVSPMDLIQVETPIKNFYSFLSIGWGLMADIDIESEKLRAIGEARFTIWALIRALGLRKYKGKLSYLPVKGYQPGKKLSNQNTKTLDQNYRVIRSKTLSSQLGQSKEFDVPKNGYRDQKPGKFCSKSYIESIPGIPEVTSSHSVELLKFNYSGEFDTSYIGKTVSGCLSDTECDDIPNDISPGDDGDTGRNCRYMPPSCVPALSEPVPEDWTVIDGEFVLVYAAHQTHLSSDVLFAPNAKLDDGIMWLVIMRADVSRAQVIYFLASLQTGDHVNIPYVDVVPVRAFRLEPYQPESLLTIDGEVIPCSAVQATVLPSVARMMTR